MTGGPGESRDRQKGDDRADVKKVAAYVLERRLDPGGNHEVWLARGADGTAVALKLGGVPQPTDREDERIPGLVPVLESGTSEGLPYQVMPLVPGITLTERLVGEALLPSEAERVITTVGRTLAALHAAGRTHGDVRPANVLLGQNGEVTLIDREQRAAATPDGDRAALAMLIRGSARSSTGA